MLIIIYITFQTHLHIQAASYNNIKTENEHKHTRMRLQYNKITYIFNFQHSDHSSITYINIPKSNTTNKTSKRNITIWATKKLHIHINEKLKQNTKR